MSLQKLELPAYLIGELYKDMLVEVPVLSDAVAPDKIAEDKMKFLGGNNKNIAFIVNYPDEVFISQSHLDWLGKMLKACQLNLGDIAIINLANNPTTIAEIKKELHSTTIILLGTEPLMIQLPMNFPHFNPQSYNGMVFLCSPPAAELNHETQEAKLLKTKLWAGLQKLFKL